MEEQGKKKANNTGSLATILTALLIATLVLSSSTALCSGTADSKGDSPIYVNFTILSAVIAPTKINGKSWDAGGTSSKGASGIGVISEMLMAGSGVPATSVISALSEVAAKGKAAPDVVGYVQQTGPTTRNLAKIAGIPMALSTRENRTKDSYIPRFSTGYSGWPVFPDTRFQIQLSDLDLMDHDHIGVVELNYEHILSVIEEGKPKWINVADQSMNQLLYILVTATKADEHTRPKMNGYEW